MLNAGENYHDPFLIRQLKSYTFANRAIEKIKNLRLNTVYCCNLNKTCKL